MNCSASAPAIALNHLDQLWFQVGGTRCNLTCHHCFISCNPHNDRFGFLSRQQVRSRLLESVGLGVREYYFTGGEPFLNPEMTDILVETLAFGPATVLTNGTVLKEAWLDRLAAAEAESPYSLEFRVSLDGYSSASNDPIRGEGTFDRALAGVRKLAARGFLPLLTIARTWSDEVHNEVIERFVAMLREAGCQRPRLKVLPTLRLGAETTRTCGYQPDERVTEALLEGFDRSQLLCHHARIVTDRGVHVCPILIESPDSLLDATLSGADQPFVLRHGACFTCYQYGAICSNPSAAPRQA